MIHETSTISPTANIANNVNVWHYSHIDDDAFVDIFSSIGQGCYVGKKVQIGKGCRVSNCVGVFTGITLEDFVFLGPFMSFTHIKSPRAFISRKRIFAETYVRKGVTIGANATVLPSLDLGSFSFIGAGSILTKSTPDYSLWVGTPARHVGWVDVFGERLPDLVPGVTRSRYICKFSGDVYEYTEQECIRTASGRLNYLLDCDENWNRAEYNNIFPS